MGKSKRWRGDKSAHYDYEANRAERVAAKQNKLTPRPKRDDLIDEWLRAQEEDED